MPYTCNCNDNDCSQAVRIVKGKEVPCINRNKPCIAPYCKDRKHIPDEGEEEK